MTPLQIDREESSGTVTLRLGGTLDSGAAELLRRAIVDAHAPVVVDLSQVRDFKDAMVPSLCRAISGSTVQLRGLGVHQSRLLKYFGVDMGEQADRGIYRAEEAFAV